MSSRRYARGKRAWGHCERSGKKLLLRDMVYDGHVRGLLVAPDWREPVHPQEYAPAVEEAVTLRDPAPPTNNVPYTVKWPLIDDRFETVRPPQAATGVGYVRIASTDNSVDGQEADTELDTPAMTSVNEPASQELGAAVDDIATFRVTLNDPGVLDQETSAELGAESTDGTVGEDGNEAGTESGAVAVAATTTLTGAQAAAELGAVNVVVVEAGWGSGAFGEGTYGN